jgi:hypothetical protein
MDNFWCAVGGFFLGVAVTSLFCGFVAAGRIKGEGRG